MSERKIETFWPFVIGLFNVFYICCNDYIHVSETRKKCPMENDSGDCF